MTTLWTPNFWPLLKGGRFSEIALLYQNEIEISKWWLLKAGVNYSEVVIHSGLTVLGI